MFCTKAVIQKIIIESQDVQLYQNFNLNSPWSFETTEISSSDRNNIDIFPFNFQGAKKFSKIRAGRETKIDIALDGRLLFADDYGIPEGLMIGILFPEGYVPEVFKFKNKPFIPTGVGNDKASMSPPGHFEVFYNRAARRSAIVFMSTQTTYFGFKCVARMKIDDFPEGADHPFLNDLYATFGFAETHPIHISSGDLFNFKEMFTSSTDLSDLAAAINRLIDLSRQNDYERVGEAQILKKKLEGALSNTASAVQLSDSYLSGGTVGALVARLCTYFAL